MVLVERAAAIKEIEPTPTPGRNGLTTGAPFAPPAATPDRVGTEAFEQIDRLLDPTSRPGPSSSASQGRWKQVPRDESEPESEAEPEAEPKREAEAEPKREAEADPAGDPIPQAGTDSSKETSSAMADDGAPPDGAIAAEPALEPVAASRRYALVAWGGLFGTVLAVGVTAAVLSRRPARFLEGASAPTAELTESTRQVPATTEEEIEAEAPAEPALPPPVDDPSSESAELTGVESDLSDSPPSDSPPPDPSPPQPVEPPPETTEEEVSLSDPPRPEPNPEAEHPAAQPPSGVATEANVLPDVRDDGLASFARWLSSASADSGKTSAPPPPTAAVAPARNEATMLAQPSRPVPQPVDVAAAQKTKVAAIEFKDEALVDVLRTVSNLSAIPITLDPDALGRRMLSPREPISLLQKDATIGELLQAVLEPLGLGYSVSEGHVLVTTRVASEGRLVTIRHDLTDLAAGRTETVVELARWLTQMVAYGTWQVQGGAGSYRVEDTVLVIDQSDTVQYEILVFCEKLRVARGLPPRSRLPAEVIRLEPVTERMAALQRPMSLRVWQEQNLDQIAARLEREAGITVLVDWQALHLAGWSPADRTRFFCQQQPLREALHSLLEPMGLTFRVIDESTLQISSPEAVDARNDVEFYGLPAQAQSAEAVQVLSAQMVERVGQSRFQPLGGGSIAYDLASQTLIISLPQTAQRQLSELVSSSPDDR